MTDECDDLCSGPLQKEEARSLVKEKTVSSKHSIFDLSVDLNHDDFYFPSVELLTAQVRPQKYAKTPLCSSTSAKSQFCLCGFQDLLSFELLDINIVQELEKVPTNTPVGKHAFTLAHIRIRRG